MPCDSEARWWVYIVVARTGALYTGVSTDPQRRLREHREGRGRGAKFFRTSPPASLVFREPHPTRTSALKREREIKGWSRARKLALIEAADGPSSVSARDR